MSEKKLKKCALSKPARYPADEEQSHVISEPPGVFGDAPAVAVLPLPDASASQTPSIPNGKKRARTGTFTDNLRLPVHRWFRYTAGFSAKWVESVMLEKRTRRLFDPFAGSGTSLLAADTLGVSSSGAESHPFVHRVASAKIGWDFDISDFIAASRTLAEIAHGFKTVENRMADPLLGRIYTPQTLDSLERLRVAHEELKAAGHSQRSVNLLWLAITSILRPCSFAGTAQWQYVLPAKTKSREKEPFAALDEVVDQMIEDRRFCTLEGWRRLSTVALHDSRHPFSGVGSCYDTVITSPPYPNNYDYADATRLEMTFWREISGWSDLQSKVRVSLMRSCSQHAAAERLNLDNLLHAPRLAPIRDEISAVCSRLAEIRLTKGGKKTYHTMIAAYFNDLADVFHNLRSITTPGATICFVIGDSAPYGVHVPAEKWLGELAVSAGFSGWRFEKLRDRNIKWDNRVHDVPLHEGNLWIHG